MSDVQPRRTLRSRDKEEIVWEAHPSWLGQYRYYRKWMGIALAASALLIALAHLGAGSYLTAIPLSLLLLGIVELPARLARRFTTYQVTRSRVYTHSGILRKRVESAPINRIENVTIDQSLVQRILKVGTVDFDTAGEHVRAFAKGKVGETPFLDWWGIRHPETVAGLVDELLTHHDTPQPQRIRTRVPAAAPVRDEDDIEPRREQHADEADQPAAGPFGGASWQDADDVDPDELGLGVPDDLRDDIIRYDD